MRYLLALMLFTAACAGVPASGQHFDSVHDRLSEEPIWLFVHDDVSSGLVTGRRLGTDGWTTSTTKFGLEHGHLRATLGDDGQLAIDELEIAIAPIVLERMFDRPA